MRFFRWLYRLPGRIDRSFSSNTIGNGRFKSASAVIAQEFENTAGSGEGDAHDDPAE